MYKRSDPFEIDVIFASTTIRISEILFETHLWDTIYFF